MGYYIDLEKLSIDDYRAKLESAYLPPSRMILKERTAERFEYFKKCGINNAKELLTALKKKDRFDLLSKADSLSAEYLTILLRELNSILPKPNKISDFIFISSETSALLEKSGIKDTLKLYDRVLTNESRKQLSKETGIAESELMKLTSLTDLSRIKWVGVTFATMLYELGIDNVEKVSKSDAEELHKMICQLNKEKSIFKGQIVLNDIRILVDAAKEIPSEIEY